MHPIYRTDVPLLPRVLFLYIYSTNIFNYFFRLSLTIFVYSSTKCRVFPNVILLGSQKFTFYINGVLNCKCPAPGPKGWNGVLWSVLEPIVKSCHTEGSVLRNTLNHLTPNDHYSGRTAPLTSKRCILYTYSTNIGTEYFKHGIYCPFFPFKMQFVSWF